MALCLNVFSLPDTHISFLKQQPHTLQDYLLGRVPAKLTCAKAKHQSVLRRLLTFLTGAKKRSLPLDWPRQDVTMIGPDVNHRNVDLYHYILNNTEERVNGAASLFQTWLAPNNHDAINMDAENESFAFRSRTASQLSALLTQLDEQTIRDRFNAWLNQHNPDYIPQEAEYQQMIGGFERFKVNVVSAVEQNRGLMWVTQQGRG